jgi:hypothetical protein
LDAAKQWVNTQPNIFVLTEDDVALQNPNRFKLRFDDFKYSDAMVNTMRVMALTYKGKQPLAIIMDMRHQTAVAQIEHNVSILFYDNSKNSRLSYHPTYNVDQKVDNFNVNLLTINNSMLL